MTRPYLVSSAVLLLLANIATAQTPRESLPRLPELAPDPARQVEAPETHEIKPVVAGEGEQGFVLNDITIEGNSAVPTDELRPIWSELIGKEVTVANLADVASRIGAAYRARGYFLSQAVLPAQTVSRGVVRIVVVEGFVDVVSLTGGAANQRRVAGNLFEPVLADRPLRQETLERSVLLSRDTFGSVYGGSVETVLGPSPATFGAANLDVVIVPEPISGYVWADNRGSRLYGDVTLGAGVRTYNLLGLNERLDGIMAYAPRNSSLGFVSLTFAAPIEPLYGSFLDGAQMEFNINASRGDPDLTKSGSPEDLRALVNQRELTAQLVVPFVRTRSENLFGRLGLGFLENETETEFAGSAVVETDRLAVLEVRTTWDYADRAGGVNLVDVSVRQGLDVGSATVSADGPAAGKPNFTSVWTQLTRLQSLGTNISLYGEVVGQYAANILPNSERFFLGDSTIGRGFAPGNTSGDSGYGARVELRRYAGPEAFSSAFRAAELYLFGDYGKAYDRAVERDGDQWETIGSVGLGARVDIRDGLTITAEIARQTEGVAIDTTDPDHETRFYFGIVARY
ncbi:MAG: POTRA domain-containing protein [Gammaproteobacteria bacterium]|jgi:hemolysin activation/secretion protein